MSLPADFVERQLKSPDGLACFMDTPASELTRDELLAIVNYLGAQIRLEREDHSRSLDMLRLATRAR